MSEKQVHEKVVERNENFYKFVTEKRTSPDDFNDWLSVVIFYTVVHHCEIALSESGVHSSSHEDRETWLDTNIYFPYAKLQKTKEMSKIYFKLKSHCNRARYKGIVPSSVELEEDYSEMERFKKISSEIFALTILKE